jgi:antitoxin component YwqK of YwqJK toxin-antitoxin module
MVTDILAMRVPGASRWTVVLAIIVCSACKQNTDAVIFYDATKVGLSTKRGITSIKNIPVTGVVFSLNSEGDTVSVIGYRDGRLHGTEKRYHRNGHLKSIRFNTNGQKIGEHKGWHENGQQSFLYHFKDDLFEGNQLEWLENGQLYSDMNYHQGHESGRQRMWYADGTIKVNYIIKNNRRYGLLGTKNCINSADSVLRSFSRM